MSDDAESEIRPIEAQELLLRSVPGIEGDLRSAAGNGIHVLVGENHAGKTRLLEQIPQARFGAWVVPAKACPEPRSHSMWGDLWPHVANERVYVAWDRDLFPPPDENPTRHPGERVKIDPASVSVAATRHVGVSQYVAFMEKTLWRHIIPRPAILVPTNRYFRQQCDLSTTGLLEDLNTWPSYLGNLERSQHSQRREEFKRINDAFGEISGLSLTSLGEQGISILHVVDHRTQRPLDDCGDGLRDILAVLTYAFQHPDADLLLDEPGLRLHPAVQRRLLRVLEAESRSRAIWIATHDGVFIGAPSVVSRFHVSRALDRDASIITPLAGREATREAMVQLGWLAQDAFLADHVLFCEGPSDRIAFERVLAWLTEADVTLGGTVLSELGGEGKVWGRDRKELLARLRMIRTVAPYASHSALLDRDGRPPDEVRALVASVEAEGYKVRLLEEADLESYWLDPGIAHAITTGIAADASAERGEEVAAPTAEQVAEHLTSAAPSGGKGSAILQGLFKAFTLRFDKPDIARHAVAFLETRDAHPMRIRLMGDVRAAVTAGSGAEGPPLQGEAANS